MATPWDEPKSSWEKYRLNQNPDAKVRHRDSP